MLLHLLAALALAAPPDLADAVAAGDCTTVNAAVPAEDPGEWRLARGWCALKTGDPEAAEALLAEPMDGVLGEYGRLFLARARLALEDPDGAAEALDGLRLPGAVGDEIRATRARLAVQRKDRAAFDAAAKGREEDPEIQYLRGVLLESLGDRDGAVALWRQVVRAAEIGGWDAKAADRLEALGISLEFEPYARALELKKAGRVREAAAMARKVEASGAAQHVALARVFMGARSYEEALEHWRSALGAPEEASGSASPLFDYALSHARLGDYETAAVVYRRVMAQHPSHAKAVFASYKLGYMAYDEGSCDEALELYGEHIAAHPDSRYLDEALWFSARCQWAAGDLEAMASTLDRLVRERPKSSLVPGAVYWKARARGLAGDAAAEEEGLASVIRRWPTSGHAWFAAERLGRRFPKKPVAERPPWPDALSADPAVQRAETLMAQGFRRYARDELAPVAGRVEGRGARLAAAWAFLEAGDYRRAQKLARPYCVSPWKDGDPVAQQACTPRPEASIVEAVAARYELNPLLPFGIMTAESALDPTVTSWAGARGLMQLMPAEGPRIHAELYPARPYDADDLYSAPYNASMGTTELGMKRQALQGVLEGTDLPAVIASYNGGEAAVRGWLPAGEEKPPFDAWSEAIEYSETRRYVKRVLGFVMAYRWVYGDP